MSGYCEWCFAAVPSGNYKSHADWHRANELHAPTCGLLVRSIAQRNTGAYIAPMPCSCGLVAAKIQQVAP